SACRAVLARPFGAGSRTLCLALAKGESVPIRVAYVPGPNLRPVAQRYACLDRRRPDGGLYRYAGRWRGFSAEPPVDADRPVRDWPETFRRAGPG
ncbi:MAG: putative glycolipid-binding domain-containing protein, partial [Kiloniellaceae bacterium]